MKGIDIFCVSQASTTICQSMEEISSSSLISPSSSPSSSSTNNLLPAGGRAIDRHNPIIRDSKRLPKPLPPCTTASQPPLSPKPARKNQPIKKKKQPKISLKENGDEPINDVHKDNNNNKPEDDDEKIVIKKKIESLNRVSDDKGKISISVVRKGWSCTRPGDFFSPPGSTRYLLGEKGSYNSVSDNFDPTQLKIFPEETSGKSNAVEKDEESVEKPPSSLSENPDQVVVLRVSLHCRGCEKKMRKHISRMEGVKSFEIDFMAKKVTVTGNVTPLSVLSSISKVKNAQLWPPALSSTIPNADNFNNSTFMQNEYKGA